MAESTETRESSGAAGSKTFAGSDSRRFNYFEPQGRRATIYEDVTVDVQPDPGRHLIQGWIMSFADGTPSYHEGTTALKSSDWHVYRAPDQEWERTHYQRQSEIERTIKTLVDSARGSGASQRFDKEWVRTLQDHVSAMKHLEFGLGVALTTAQRDGVTQMINNSILTNASYKLRLAQDITLYLGDIGLDVEIDGDAGKKRWLDDPIWQGVRKVTEGILATADHLEVYLATNLALEPLVGDLLRNGFITRAAPLHSDFVTPGVLAPAAIDCQRNLANAMALTQLLVDDATHGEANRKTVAGWLAVHVPRCLEAAKAAKPLWDDHPSDSVDFAEAFDDATQNFQSVLSELGIELPDIGFPNGVSL